ncbi:MAG: HU family DNA-binding protein [Gracilimonas sp.]|uniref:HU family DNA-binding protein n=1 Tax=Gracilimonas sp. TaxID=1974203 RepID=UPI0019878DEF|nr:HU family DNA-binding protein [Gracilimonas sp.]MBD3616714.1 HU family DNA-binding protein [Gracilimonas sp.]
MPVNFNVIERAEPGVEGGGNRKFYASAISKGSKGIEELTDRIEKISTVSGADIRAVLYAIIDIVPEMLSDGNIVNIGDLGSFRVSISSEGSVTAEEVDSSHITDARILFRPGNKFDEMLKNLSYEKASA